MTTPPHARERTVAFLTGATLGALVGLLLGSWAGEALLHPLVSLWRWVREEVIQREDEVDFELLLQ
jgi:hypothetical protein